MEIEETVMLQLRDKLRRRLESPKKEVLVAEVEDKETRLQGLIEHNRDGMRREAERKAELEAINRKLLQEVEVLASLRRG